MEKGCDRSYFRPNLFFFCFVIFFSGFSRFYENLSQVCLLSFGVITVSQNKLFLTTDSWWCPYVEGTNPTLPRILRDFFTILISNFTVQIGSVS